MCVITLFSILDQASLFKLVYYIFGLVLGIENTSMMGILIVYHFLGSVLALNIKHVQ